MKKTFTMTHPKIKTPRLFEAAKNEVRKYIKRERRRELPEGVDYWDFDCKFGTSEEDAEVVHLSEITDRISAAEAKGLEQIYVEVWAQPAVRAKKSADDSDDSDESGDNDDKSE